MNTKIKDMGEENVYMVFYTTSYSLNDFMQRITKNNAPKITNVILIFLQQFNKQEVN